MQKHEEQVVQTVVRNHLLVDGLEAVGVVAIIHKPHFGDPNDDVILEIDLLTRLTSVKSMVEVVQLLNGSEFADDVLDYLNAVFLEVPKKIEQLQPVLRVYDAHVAILPLHFQACFALLHLVVGFLRKHVFWGRLLSPAKHFKLISSSRHKGNLLRRYR